MTFKVRIGSFEHRGVHDVQVNSSFETLTDTCTIEFSRKISWRGRELATGPDPLIKRGDAVRVELGYEDRNQLVFAGFVRDVTAEIPAKVHCEDYAYLLKQGSYTGSFSSVNLSTLLAEVLPSSVDYQIAAERNLGQWRISRATPAKVIDKIKKDYRAWTWFRAGVMYSGLAFVPALQRTHRIKFERNIISHSLEFRRVEDVAILAKGIILDASNQKREVEVGEQGGEQRTYHYYSVPVDEVKKRLEAEIERLRFDGYRGSFVTYGEPMIEHGDVVELTSREFPDRDGSYLVKSVTKKFGLGGYRQAVELETKIS